MRGKILSSILILIFICFFRTASAQWVQQTNPTGTFLQDISFINDNTGWICGNGVAKTTNGGINWVNVSNPESNAIIDIRFIDANTGFAGSFFFWKTTNGGNNWTKVVPDAGNYCDMSFINSSTGWVVSNSNGIWRTTDSGNNWTMVNNQYNHTFNSISFVNVNTGWAGGYDGKLFKTTDGGINWTAQTSGTTEDLYAIRFSDANTGRAAGVGSSYVRTTNGGTNWTSVAGPFGYRYDKLSFINSSTGWLIGVYGIALTTDNGTTWIIQTPPSSDGNFFGISYISPNTLYVGNNKIYKSTSGGFNLNAPSNLTLTPVSTSQINLSWTDNSTDEDKFMIERSTNGSSWALLDSVGAGVTSYQSTGLTSNTDYYFRVNPKRIIFTGEYSNSANDRPFMIPPSHTSPANNSVSKTLTPTLTWSTASGGLIYYLQVASDSNFSNIVYSNSGVGYTSQTIPAANLQNSKKYFWHTRVTNFGNESPYSDFWSFTVQDSNYGNNMQTGNNLYYFANSTSGSNSSPSKPTFNWRDTTGSTDLILNRTARVTINAGDIDDGRFDLSGKLPVGNSIRFFGTNYENLYIGTNGIIGFSTFSPGGAGYYQPNSSLPQFNIPSAIFACWKDLNFGDADIPVNRLCYKVTSNEIIITYMNAPNYNNSGSDPNDYVSFQVIISHSASPSINSNIGVQYNYDQTGSSFITKYNTNTLQPYIIGLQGTNSSAQVLQYRYMNSSQLISSGPMFGSNLALAFGPNVNALPVELSSFTSDVNGSNVRLNWSTVNEQNNSGFEIQRTNANENNWKKINFVEGNRTTNEAKDYSYEDRNISSGKYQYRLKQIDFNGNYEYFQLNHEVEIGVPKKFSLSQNYPNPFNPATKINFELPNSSKVKISVYDITGKLMSELLNTEKAAGYYTVEFNGVNLSSGMYFYRIEAGDFSAVKKMILIK